MDPGLDQDKTELGVLVLSVDLEVLAHGNRLFDEVPKVLRDGWAKSYPQTKGVCIQIHGKRKGKDGDGWRESPCERYSTYGE